MKNIKKIESEITNNMLGADKTVEIKLGRFDWNRTNRIYIILFICADKIVYGDLLRIEQT